VGRLPSPEIYQDCAWPSGSVALRFVQIGLHVINSWVSRQLLEIAGRYNQYRYPQIVGEGKAGSFVLVNQSSFQATKHLPSKANYRRLIHFYHPSPFVQPLSYSSNYKSCCGLLFGFDVVGNNPIKKLHQSMSLTHAISIDTGSGLVSC